MVWCKFNIASFQWPWLGVSLCGEDQSIASFESRFRGWIMTSVSCRRRPQVMISPSLDGDSILFTKSSTQSLFSNLRRRCCLEYTTLSWRRNPPSCRKSESHWRSSQSFALNGSTWTLRHGKIKGILDTFTIAGSGDTPSARSDGISMESGGKWTQPRFVR